MSSAASSDNDIILSIDTSSRLSSMCLLQVRKQLRDMEAKVKDQEEELDEQAGTIQMLEQVRQPMTSSIGTTGTGRVKMRQKQSMSPRRHHPHRLCVVQAKLRLEMEMERLRQSHSKEMESKEDEMEDIRQSCSKRVSVRRGDSGTDRVLSFMNV